jgi:hypothetical protein
MTATNYPLEGMDGGKESVALSAIVEAVTWRHALEITSDPKYQQRWQRIIVCPKFLTKFETVLTKGNVGFDMEGGHDVAYEKIIGECRCYREDCRPLFLPKDGEAVRN